MKSCTVALFGLGFVALATLAVGQDTPKGAAPAQLKDLRAKASYGLGVNLGNSLKKSSVDIDAELLYRGLKDALAGGKVLMTEEEMQATMQTFQQEVRAKQMEAAKGAGDRNKKEGDAFLAANKAKPGVVALPSGLQYKVLKEGTGKTPRAIDTVTTHYRGTLLDGTEFDSSLKTGKPVSFPVNGVIPGWTEALQRMKVGSKWQLFIPSDLAYGANPPTPKIPPNSTLVFDVELLGIQGGQ